MFITGNKQKVWQANDALKQYGIQVEAKALDVVEIQSHDPLKVALAKAKSAYELAGEPVVICDLSWSIPALNGFPGAYMKDINHWFTPEDFLNLMKDKADQSLTLKETIVYTDGATAEHFSADFPAKFTYEPRGEHEDPDAKVIIYDGRNKTIADQGCRGRRSRLETHSGGKSRA